MKKTPLLLIMALLLMLTTLPVAAQGGEPVSATAVFGAAILRQGPDLYYPEAGRAAQGEALILSGRLEDGSWYQVLLDTGLTAWLPAYSVTVNGDPSRLPVVVFEPPQSNELYVPPGCNYFGIGPFLGHSGQSIILTQGWEAASEELIKDYLNNVIQVVSFDGRLISTYNAYRSDIFFDQMRGTWRVFWSFDMGPVAIGEHTTEWTQMFSQQITDGLDANGDGQMDTYGPDSTTAGCTIIIQ